MLELGHNAQGDDAHAVSESYLYLRAGHDICAALGAAILVRATYYLKG